MIITELNQSGKMKNSYNCWTESIAKIDNVARLTNKKKWLSYWQKLPAKDLT